MSQPAQTPPPPAEKARRGRHWSIRTKITFWAGLGLVLVSLILIGYSVIALRQAAIDNATSEALFISEMQAGFVMDVLNTPLMTARALADSLEAVKDASIPTTLSRDETNAMLRRVLVENPSFLGVYTLWEPNEFDGIDDQYVRAVAHDATGRFIPYWVRDLDGIIHTEALAQYEIPGVGDWYILPRSTMQEVTIAPIVRSIQGQDLTIASFVVPIISNGKFYGIAGVDAPIGVMQELVDNLNLYDGTAEVALFTEDGTLVAVRNRPEIANQSVSLVYQNYNEIQSQLDSTFSRLSQDGQYLQVFTPIEVDESGTNWVLGLSIPFNKITAPATTAAVRQVAISFALILFALIFLWMAAGQIVRPMQTLTRAAEAVSQGNLAVTATVNSRDETQILAEAFNTMTQQLASLFGSLEQRVAERTRALSSVAEVSIAASTVLETDKLLQQVVDLAKERFGLYHAHIYLLNEAGDTLVLASGAGEPGRQMVARGHSIPLSREQSLVARAARERKGVTVNDVTQAPDFLPNPLLPNTRSEMAVPMVVGDQVIGVFDVQSDVVGRFTDADVNIQTTMASQIAASVQNALQVEQTFATAAELAGIQNAISNAAIVAITDVSGRILEANDNFTRISQYSREELLGQDHRILNSGYHSKEFMREMWTTIAHGKVWRGEIRNKAKDGSFYWVDSVIAPILNEAGKPVRYVAVRYDITQRKQLELETARRAHGLEILDSIAQKIQSADTVESALQVAARELGRALGQKQTLVMLDAAVLAGEQKE